MFAMVVLVGALVLVLGSAGLVAGWYLLHQWAIEQMEDLLAEGNQLPTLVGMVLVRWHRWKCGRFGHAEQLNLTFERVWLSCHRCGWESRGVTLARGQVEPRRTERVSSTASRANLRVIVKHCS